MKPGMKKLLYGLAITVSLILVTGALVMMARRHSVQVAPGERLVAYSHRPWSEVLAAHGRDGLFDYVGLRRKDELQLNQFLDAVARFGPNSTPEMFSRPADQLAFYLNAYNAIMVRKWLDAGAGDAGGSLVVKTRWYFFDLWRVDGEWVSLDSLEHEIIRPTFADHRVHFALVCGAMGCPPLLEDAFQADRIDEQLDDLGRRWLIEPDGLQMTEEGNVRLSSIFNWYRRDFDEAGGLPGVLERYLAEDDPRRESAISAAKDGRIEFMPYDWSINQVP